MKSPEEFQSNLTTPRAIIIGSLIISLSILVSGGIISPKGPKVTATNNPQVTPQVSKAPEQPTVTLNTIKDVFGKSMIKFGNANSKLIFIEVADPSCPYCQIAAGKNSELNKQAGSRFTLVADGGTYVAPVPEMEKMMKNGQAAFAFIYSPGHGNGEMGTKAFYCAFEKGKFWEVHDMLMSAKGYDLLNNIVKNDKSKSGEMADFLQPVFDSAAMKQCLDSGKYDDRLKQDTALAASLDISGTPGFYVNTTKYAGAYSYKDLEATINSILK